MVTFPKSLWEPILPAGLLFNGLCCSNSKNLLSVQRKPLIQPALRALGLLLAHGAPSGKGEDFLMGQLNFFTETAVNPERKVENRSQGGKLTVMPRAKNGSLTKIGVVWQKSDFWTKNRNFGPKKRGPLLGISHVLATTGKSCSKKKKCLCPNNHGGKYHFGCVCGARDHHYDRLLTIKE